MKKLIGKNSIYLMGKIWDIKLQLSLISDKNMTVADYIKQQTEIYKKSLN